MVELKKDEIPHDLRVETDLEFAGMVRGDVTVVAPANFRLSGTVLGSVYIEAGAHADINGRVFRAVVNRGFLQLQGVVGALRSDGGISVVDGGARVGSW